MEFGVYNMEICARKTAGNHKTFFLKTIKYRTLMKKFISGPKQYIDEIFHMIKMFSTDIMQYFGKHCEMKILEVEEMGLEFQLKQLIIGET